MIVIEISSFQLDTIEKFRPRIGIILNISEDHLDRYENMEAYALSKANMFKNQGETDIAILNQLDKEILDKTKKVKSKVLYFNSLSETGALIEKDEIQFRTENANFSVETKDKGVQAVPCQIRLEN